MGVRDLLAGVRAAVEDEAVTRIGDPLFDRDAVR